MERNTNIGEERPAITSAEVLGVTRRLLDDIMRYVDYKFKREPDFYDVLQYDSRAKAYTHELLNNFIHLAEQQLAMWVIDQRLTLLDEDASVHDDTLYAFAVMDTELASWERYGIVKSQEEPLQIFTSFLFDLQQEIDDEAVEDERLRGRITRDMTSARERLGTYLDP